MYQFLDTLQKFQPLATGIFAVIAAAIGFAGVWYSQNRIARNAREDRDHREKIAREEREHRETMAKRGLEEEIENRRTIFIHAISGELTALHQMIGVMHQFSLLALKAYEGFAETLGNELKVQPKLPFYKFASPVYDHHIADVGLLPASLTYSVVSAYTRLKTAANFDQYTSEIPNLALSHMSSLARGMTDAYLQLAKDIHDVVMRLHAVRLGYNDPGPGKGEEFGKTLPSTVGDAIAQKDMQADPQSSLITQAAC
jgi:hypothetical protein